jgi:hypothetical protein
MNQNYDTKTKKGWLPWAMIMFALEFLFFRTYYVTNYQPYYPRSADQTVFIQSEYMTYYSLSEHGLVHTLKNLGALQGQIFKGPIAPNLGVLFMFLFGPNRLSAALVNFLFFAMGQLFLFLYFKKRIDIYAGLVAVALFFLSITHYYWAGGLNDLRLDYAGMVTFGLAFIALNHLISVPTLRNFLLSGISIGISLATRSITGVYLIAIVFSINAFLWLSIKHKSFRQVNSEQLKYFRYLLVSIAVVAGIAFIAVRGGMVNYYSSMFQGPERAIRSAESGVLTALDNLLYYPRSASEHFEYYGYILIGMILFQGLKEFSERRRPHKNNVAQDFGLWNYLIVFLIAVFCVWLILLLYSQSPLTIGILTIPIVFVLTMIISKQLNTVSENIRSIISAAIFLVGFLFYVSNMITPRALSPADIVEAKRINALYADIADVITGGNTRNLSWLINHDALIPPSFYIYLYEHDRRMDVPLVSSAAPRIFSMTETDIIKQIEASDVIVAPLYFNQQVSYEFPYTQSLRQYETSWRGKLNTEFILKQKYYLTYQPIGLYIRPCRIVDLQVPNGVEVGSNIRFWLGDSPVEIQIENFSKQPLAADFIATGVPGPSDGNIKKSTLSYEINGNTQNLVLNDADGWQFTIPMILQPGENALTLVDLDKAKLNANSDPRSLLLQVSEIKLSCYTP